MITMKTKLHKLASLLLAFALTLCLALPAGAVEGETRLTEASTGTITITGIEEASTDRLTATAYKIIEVDYYNTTDPDYDAPQNPEFYWVSDDSASADNADKSVANWVRTTNSGGYKNYIGTAAAGTTPADNSVQSAFAVVTGEDADAYANTIAAFYDDLANAIRNETVTFASPGYKYTGTLTKGSDADTSVTCEFSALPMGSYLVLIEGGMKVYKPVVVNLVPEWNKTEAKWELKADVPTELNVKYSEPTIEKKVTDTADSTKEKPMTPSDWAQVDIGDTVTYTLTAAVPTFPEDAINKGYQISDTLPDGMTLGTIKVMGYTGDSDETGHELTAKSANNEDSYQYELKVTNKSAQPQLIATRPVDSDDEDTYLDEVTFNLEFNYDNLKTTGDSSARFTKIVVTYTATANENIKVYGDSLGADKGTSTGNENTAYLDYNNNPYQKETDREPLEWVSKEDSAFVYTYGIKVDKVSDKQESGQDVYLPGAEFTLHRTNSQGDKEGAPINFVAVDADNGVYRVAKQTEASGTTTTTTLTVGKEDTTENDSRAGKLDIRGLDVGTYILTETKAPDGYNLPSKAIEIIINDSKTSGSGDSYQNGANGITDTTDNSDNTTEADDGYVSTKITNTKGFTLPTTGGMGTVLFTAGGVLLMGAGLVVLVLFLRRRTSR